MNTACTLCVDLIVRLPMQQHPVVVGSLEWDRPLVELGGVELVLAADVTYDPQVVPALVGLIAALLRRGAAAAYISALQRNPATLQCFEAAAGAVGLRCELRAWGDIAAGVQHAVCLEDEDILQRLRLYMLSLA